MFQRACRAVLLSTIAICVCPVAAMAQEAPAAPAGDEMASGADREIIVTAQRREESLVNVPISVAAVTGAELERASISNVESLQRIVPGLTITFAGAYSQPTIRGVGSQVAGPGLPSNVATYLDGFYRPNPVANNFELADVDSVQVLKGPQGTLYGRNATGGALLITTREPTSEPTLDLRLRYSRFNEIRAGAFVSGPLTETLSASLTLYNRVGDTFNRNIATDAEREERRLSMVRGKLKFEPSANAEFTLAVEHTDVDDPSTYMFSNDRGISAGAFVPGAVVASRPREYSNDYQPIFDSRQTGIFLKGEFDFGWARLTSLTSAEWQRNLSGYDVDGSSAPIQHVYFPGRQETQAQELILSSATESRLQWLLGGFFFRDDGDITLSDITSGTLVEIIDGGVKTKSFAFYGDVTYEVVPRLFATAGVRYSRDKLVEHFTSIFDPSLTTASKSFEALTPRASLRYQLADRTSLYASYNAGYKSGGFNPSTLSIVPVRPEKIDAFELGFKHASRAFDFNLAGYYYKYDDLQVTAYQGPITSLVNAAKAKIYGIEADVAIRPVAGLTITAAGAWNHARYKSFPGAPLYAFDPVTGISVTPGDASGRPIVNAPEFSGNVNATYVQPLPSGSLEFTGNFSYQSVVYYDAFQATRQDAYGVLNLRAAWNSGDDRLSIALFLDNATNKDYVRSIFQQPVAFSSSWAPPRSAGIELRYRL